MSKKIAVFASGNGSNFQVIAEQFDVTFVFSDHRDAYVLERAKHLGVKSHAFELKEFPDKQAYEKAIVDLLDKEKIDLVCLAGYMKIVGETLLSAYEGKIINIHPAYLPEFPGAHGIEDAWKAGVDQSGVTIHWVDAGVDTGKIIQQVRVPRLANDTLDSFEERIHAAEYDLYPQVLESLGVEMTKESSLLKKFENDELKELFLNIVGTKDWNDSVDKFRKKIKDLNPWAEKNNSEEFPSLAKEDECDLKDLLVSNIGESQGISEKRIFAPFQDFEQAFDGNLETPKVLFLGINPKFVYGHEDYGLKETVYTHIFNKNRPPLNKLGTHKAGSKKELSDADYQTLNDKDDYYFKDDGFFYTKSMDEEVRNKHRKQCLCINKEPDSSIPVAFIELFPYASSSTETWLKLGDLSIDLKISPSIKKYIKLEKLLYSQQWLLCLIAFILKNDKNKDLVIFLRNNNIHSRTLLTELFKLVYDDKLNEKIEKNQILVKARAQTQKFSLGNAKQFDKDGKGKKLQHLDRMKESKRQKAELEFFKSVWNKNKEKK